jgi:hypothetical protein
MCYLASRETETYMLVLPNNWFGIGSCRAYSDSDVSIVLRLGICVLTCPIPYPCQSNFKMDAINLPALSLTRDTGSTKWFFSSMQV